jgi:uncharacterized protein (TIGR00730 family)
MLTAPSQAYVYFPGGFGTLDELFQVLKESSIGFTQKVPIILVGKDFWQPLIDFFQFQCMGEVPAINSDYLESVVVVDSAEEAFSIIKTTEDHPNLADLSPGNLAGSESSINWRIFKIMSEFVEGLDYLSHLDKNVTMLGTSKMTPDSDYYQKAYQISKKLAEKGYTILTGGGSGLAEAANKASYDAGKPAYGLGLALQDGYKRQQANPYVSDLLTFKFPFTRQFILTGPRNSYIFCPGGLGTLHQLFEVLTLVQTRKVTTSPLILFDAGFWQPLIDYIDRVLYQEFGTISPEDRELYQVVSEPNKVVEVVDGAFQSQSQKE